MADGVAGGVGGPCAKGVPVGGEHHAVPRPQASRNHRQHVVADEPVNADAKVGRETGRRQGDGREVRPPGADLLRLEIEPGPGEQIDGDLALDPALHQRMNRGGIGADHVVAVAVGGHDGGPGIGRARRLVDDQRAQGAAPGGLLELVDPTAIVGGRLAAKAAGHRLAGRGFEIGVVDQDDGDLAPQIDALEIVPSPLRRRDAVADEHQRRLVDDHARDRTLGPDHGVAGLDQVAGRIAAGGQGYPRAGGDLEVDQRHGLGPAALVAGRLQPQRLELTDDVANGPGLARPARRSAGQRAVGQHPDVSRKLLRGNRPGRWGRGGQGREQGGGDKRKHAHGTSLPTKCRP